MHTVHGWLSKKQSRPAVRRLESNTSLPVVTEETQVSLAHCSALQSSLFTQKGQKILQARQWNICSLMCKINKRAMLQTNICLVQ